MPPDALVTYVLLLHAGVTLALVGVIWTVQLVHYPLFAAVGDDCFADYQVAHMRRITWVVAPLMLTELSTAIAIPWLPLPEVQRWIVWLGIVLLGAIWLSTALLQVPVHRELTRGFAAALHRRLVRSNWIRTICWSVRGVVSAILLYQYFIPTR